MHSTLLYISENESKQNLNYNDKNRLVAYAQQSLHGPLAEANVAPLGALDVIGRDRRYLFSYTYIFFNNLMFSSIIPVIIMSNDERCLF